jgi:PAS domain S-box-containing protein
MHSRDRRRNVLILSDEPNIARKIDHGLQQHGYTTLTTAFQDMKRLLLSDFQPDLALLIRTKPSLPESWNRSAFGQDFSVPLVFLLPQVAETGLVQTTPVPIYHLPQHIPVPVLALTITQILENHHVRKELRRQRSYCQVLIRDLSDGLFMLKGSGEITFASASVKELIGKPPREIVGHNLSELVHPKDRLTLNRALAQLRAGTKEALSLSCRLRHRAGTWQTVEAVIKAHLEDPGVHAILLSVRDVTEQDLITNKLQQRNLELALLNQAVRAFSATLNLDEVLVRVLERTRQLMDVVACSIWLIEPNSDLIVCRQATGPQRNVVQGWQLPKDEGLVGWVAQSGESLNVPDVLADKRHFKRVDNETGLSLRSILTVPLRTKNEIIGSLQALDSEPHRFTDSDTTLLEALAASAASAIENARLVNALKRRSRELRESNKELEAFAHTVAHDLKSPLTHIVGYADILSTCTEDITEDRTQKYLQAIQRSGRKMTNIIDELLLLAQLRQEDVTLMKLDMRYVVKEALERLQPLIDRHNVEISLPERWPSSLGYAPWVEEVWVNYLSNAIKYGGTPPRVEMGTERKGEDYVRFWVKDNGEGLSQEEQERLFIPFTRMDEIRAQGYGLGLSIVQRIVQKLNGEVWVESTKGEGSTFGFTLKAPEG